MKNIHFISIFWGREGLSVGALCVLQIVTKPQCPVGLMRKINMIKIWGAGRQMAAMHLGTK